MIGFWGDRVMRQLPHFPIYPTSPLPHFPTSPHPTPHT
ncbi:MAG: bacitracin ABC transporter ATP-binding protein, partial [Microcystis aeruginosa K13-05]|nr:bacitracin ABC transporter ATP-binding protein [Microcystis aeruginosa K13-05]